MSFTDRNGIEWRNLTEQVLKNKTDIDNLLSGAATLAEFGIKIIKVSDTGIKPTEPPEIMPGDNNAFGYAWLVDVGSILPIYHLYIWTRTEFISEATWIDMGEFPKPGPKGNQGEKGLTGNQGMAGKPGSRGTIITIGNQPNNSIENDIWIDYLKNMHKWNGIQWTNEGSLTGATGATGATGEAGTTPHIGSNKNWYLGSNDTGIKAEGLDGASVEIQTGIYKIETLPSFESTEAGQGFIVKDNNDYDLYFHGVGGINWTVVNGWGGIKGDAGEGVPSGGEVGQILTKIDNADYATSWTTIEKNIKIWNANITMVSGTPNIITLTIEAGVGATPTGYSSDFSGVFGIRIINANQYSNINQETIVKLEIKYAIPIGTGVSTGKATYSLLSVLTNGKEIGTESNPYNNWNHIYQGTELISVPGYQEILNRKAYLINNRLAISAELIDINNRLNKLEAYQKNTPTVKNMMIPLANVTNAPIDDFFTASGTVHASTNDAISGSPACIKLDAGTTTNRAITFTLTSNFTIMMAYNGNGSSKTLFIANIDTGSMVSLDSSKQAGTNKEYSGTLPAGKYAIYSGTGGTFIQSIIISYNQ